jgi:lysophospholipase L1-like esterase
MKRTIAALAFLIVTGLFSPASADAPDPDPARFAEAIDSFGAWDRKNAIPAHPILFVGSSSISLWATAEAFAGKPVVNRGFGGSDLSDVAHYYDQVIAPYAPAQIFLYAGDNDVARDKSAQQVFEDYRELAERVTRDFPDTQLVFLSIKPSKARWALWPEMQEANELIRQFTEAHPNLAYADVASVLLDENGLPRDAFIEDGLHLNEEGYRLWQAVLASYVKQTP